MKVWHLIDDELQKAVESAIANGCATPSCVQQRIFKGRGRGWVENHMTRNPRRILHLAAAEKFGQLRWEQDAALRDASRPAPRFNHIAARAEALDLPRSTPTWRVRAVENGQAPTITREEWGRIETENLNQVFVDSMNAIKDLGVREFLRDLDVSDNVPGKGWKRRGDLTESDLRRMAASATERAITSGGMAQAYLNFADRLRTEGAETLADLN